MTMEEAVSQAFGAQMVASELVRRLLLLEITPNAENPAIVVFTGYGLPLADHARKVSDDLSSAPIVVLGPDNLCAADESKRTLDAMSYRAYIVGRDEEAKIARRVEADASNDTQSTLGQATVAARWVEKEGIRTAALVTTAYHQPRAYMTLLKSLIKKGIANRVRLFPKPYDAWPDWAVTDPDLKGTKSWARSFSEDELPKIIDYQNKGDVASWEELEACLERLGRNS